MKQKSEMKSIIPFVFKYLAIWIILSICYFFSAETITNWIAPGLGSVETWLAVLAIGLILIFILVTTAFFIGLKRRKRSFLPR